MADADADDAGRGRAASSADLSGASGASEQRLERVFIVSNSLPLKMWEDKNAGKPYGHEYAFAHDGDSIYHQTRDGARANGPVSYTHLTLPTILLV